MSPLAPVRMLLLALVSWAILGAGIYFSYETYRAFSQSTAKIAVDVAIAEPVDQNANQPASAVQENQIQTIVYSERSEWWPWAALGLAIACVALSFGGRWPVRLIFSQRNKHQDAIGQPNLSPLTSFRIERPDGSQLYGEVYGSADRPTLVLTHGWSLDSSAWKFMLPALVAKYRVVVWDLPGLGKSQAPQTNDYSIEKMALDLQAVIDEASPGEPVVLIGHSIGGMIQQTYCRICAEHLGSMVKGIVLVHTTFTNPLLTNFASSIAKPLEPLIRLLNASMIPLAPLYWLSNLQSYWNGTLHLAARFESFTGKQSWEQLDFSAWKGAVASPRVVAHGNFAMLKFDEQPTLPEVHVPTLVISGRHDRLTIQDASRRIEALLPDDTAFDDQGGHLGHVEFCDDAVRSIIGFTERVFLKSASLATIFFLCWLI